MKKEEVSAGLGKEAVRERRKIKIKSFKKNKLAGFGLILTVIVVFIGIFANVICPEGPYVMDVTRRYTAPCSKFIFGTDKMGRSVLSRIVYGIRISLIVGAVTTVITFILGMILGMLAGYFKKADNM